MTKKRWLTAAVLVVALLAGGGFLVANSGGSDLPVVSTAPAYTLENLEGKKVTSEEVGGGKVRLVEFLFTNCADICPMTTANMVTIQKKLKEDGLFGDKVEFVSITFDPERDTPEQLQAYAESHGIDQNGWTFLRGTEKETWKTAEDFGAYVEKQPDGNFAHSITSLFLVDQDNNVRQVFKMGEEMPTDEVYEEIKKLAGGGGLFS